MNSSDNSTLLDSDENVIICGNNLDYISIVKFSIKGKKLWRKDYLIWDSAFANAIAQTGNRNLYICGDVIKNREDYNRDILLVKANSNGDTLWTKTYGGTKDENGLNIITTSDGNLLIAGKTESFGADSYGDIYLLKLNQDGDTLWTRHYSDPGQQFPASLTEMCDGSYLVTGNYMGKEAFKTNENYLLKVDTNGNKMWDRKYGPHEWMWSYSSVELNSGEILTCGRITEDGYSQVLLLRADKDGNYYREYSYGSPKLTEVGYSIKQNNDDTFTIAGSSFDVTTGLNEIITLKIREDGAQVWFKRFGTSENSNGYNLLKTSNNDNVVTGNYDYNMFMTVLKDDGKFR